MARMLEEGQKTRELENRAYVGASHVKYQPIEGLADESRILVKLINTGRTPAVGRATSVLVFTPERQLPDDFMVADPAWDFARMGPGKKVFLPGEDMPLDAGTIPTFNLREKPKVAPPGYKLKTPVVNYNPNNRVYGNDATLFVVGVIEYQDFFNVKRSTVFCYATNKRRIDVWVLCVNLNHFN